MDSSYIYDSELLYECFNVRKSYNGIHIYNSENVVDSAFCDSVQNCQNCFLCTNLSGKKYHFMNEELSKEEYKKRVAEIQGYILQQKVLERFHKLRAKKTVKYSNIVNSEGCTGDFIRNSKNCIDCYDINDSEDCRYVHVGVQAKNLLDCSNMYINPEFSYQVMGVIGTNNIHFCFYVFHSSEVWYSEHCHHSSNLFGCVGLKNKKYCILNKQYTKEEYEKLREKIIKHMKKTGEWGEFFPTSISPFVYNETLASEYFPFSEEEATKRGYQWRNDDEKACLSQAYEISDCISDVSDTITSEILACESCKRNYRIIEPELKFYRDMNIPIPHKCPDCRHNDRMMLRNPRKLWERNCMKCTKKIASTYAPERPEKVYCEECYLKEVY
ncbi:hypothetical protein HZA38_05720 [Candidatus Peregrinibacteria bacterium]|nr:hypothetical protein [Candidatus Peregrinibacteria bacterium]